MKKIGDGHQQSGVSVGTQTEVIQRDYVSANILSSFYRESDGFPAIFYKSRTISQMVLLLVSLYFLAIHLESDTMPNSARRGFLMACVTMVVFAMIYFPNTYMQRPHPAIWRILQGWGVCYLMSVVFALFFSTEQLQLFFSTFIDPNLGKPLKEKSYASDCRLFTPDHPKSYMANIADAMDVFVLAHAFGWMVKMFALRDLKLAMIQQIMFELMEITFRHWLPNFYECWWDHIILDIIICNTGGILAASYLMKKFGMKEYKWSLRQNKESAGFWKNVKALFITPNLENHEWKMFSSTKRFLSVLWFVIFMNLIDLSYFFNKYILWIEPNHTIMKFRVFGLGFLSIAAAREYYVYISDLNVKRMGPSAWLVFMIVLVEWLLFAKNYKGFKLILQLGIFKNSFPDYVIWIWSFIAVVFFLILGLLIYRDLNKKTSKDQKLE